MDASNPADIIPFAFGDNLVRTLRDEDGNPWVVAKDIARALEYPASSLEQMNNVCRAVPEEWKGHNPVMTPGGLQSMLTLSEQGLYFFLARSDKPGALPFQKWLAGEVLPALRRHGAYRLPAVGADAGLLLENLPDDVARLSPRVRERCLGYALQTARLTGVGDAAALRQLFLSCCRVVAGPSMPEPDMPPDDAAELVARFVREACESARVHTIGSQRLWKVFRRWCVDALGMDEADLISNKAFSRHVVRLPGVRCVRRRPTTIWGGLKPKPAWG